jgi:hypothetical protein
MSLLNVMGRRLRTGDPAATVDRLFSSNHVKDLRLIINVTLWAVVLAVPIGLLLSFEYEVVTQWKQIADRRSDWIFVHIAFAAAGNLFAWLGPGLAVVGAVLAWAYQVGSARLGVVDLFACEVSTLCRIATVLDTARHFTDHFKLGPTAQPQGSDAQCAPVAHFTSQEDYFPVFENNTGDLQALEARVVVNITAFYTYVKAWRDSLRALAEIRPAPAEIRAPQGNAATTGPWHDAARNIVYVMFLGLESARKAVEDLVEFEPESAERSIVILISELEAYRFLREQFADPKDIRHQRILLRLAGYQRLVPELCAVVENGRAEEHSSGDRREPHQPPQISQWQPAWLLLDELRKRYDAAMSVAG